jgi:hypothetical protein
MERFWRRVGLGLFVIACLRFLEREGFLGRMGIYGTQVLNGYDFAIYNQANI